MGTSASFRAPNTPRWQAFAMALQSGQPLERLQSELFNAGADWERELGAPAVAAYAVALLEAHAGLADQLRAAERPEQALQATIAEARAASEALPGSAAGALAERAFLSLLTRVASGSQALADAAPAQAAEQFASARGTPSELIAGYVGELLGQYARSVAAGLRPDATALHRRRRQRLILPALERRGRRVAIYATPTTSFDHPAPTSRPVLEKYDRTFAARLSDTCPEP